MEMNFQEMAAVCELMGDHKGGIWGQNTALWALVALILIVALFWWCYRNGDDKANLAASVQKLYGRVDAIEPAVTAHGNAINDLNSVTSATKQAVGDFKQNALYRLNGLDDAVFAPRYAYAEHHRGCGCGDSRFVKKSTFTPDTVSIEQIETCNS